MCWRRLFNSKFNINVRVAVNVSTRMTHTHIRIKPATPAPAAAAAAAATAKTTAAQFCKTAKPANTTKTTTTVAIRKTKMPASATSKAAAIMPSDARTTTMKRIGKNKALSDCSTSGSGSDSDSGRSSNGGGSGISLILIMNLLFILLLSLCCDVCKSNEFPLQPVNNNGTDNVSHHGEGQALAAKLSKAANIDNANVDVLAAAGSLINQINANFNTNINSYSKMGNATAAAGDNEGAFVNITKTIEFITRDCLQRCIAEEDVFLDDFGIKCTSDDKSEKCFKSRCFKGCEQWWRALKEFEPCPEACSSTQFYPSNMPCISACEISQWHYWYLQRMRMAPMVHDTMPILLNDSLTASSLTLKWPITFPDNYLTIRPFNIQYQYATSRNDSRIVQQQQLAEEVEEQHWFNLADYNCNENFECEILDGLMPYTSYRFRFELPFGENCDDVLYSLPTEIFQTHAKGSPISMPTITNAFPLDDTHVAVFWQPGQFINGPLVGFRLILKSENITLEKNVSSHLREYIFNELTPSTNYTINIAMSNAEGDGPFVVHNITTTGNELKKSYDLFENLNSLLIAGEYSIKLKSLESMTETKLIYESEQLISDYDLFMAEQRLFVVDASGRVYSVPLDNPNEKVLMHMNTTLEYFKANKITVDWLNQRIYLAGKTQSQLWALAVYDLDGNSPLQLLPTTDAIKNESIKQLQVDPINGWLFWTHTTSGNFRRMNLANNAIQSILVPSNNSNTQMGYFFNDFHRYLLLAYNKSTKELFELSYDGAYTAKLAMNTTRIIIQGELQSFIKLGSTILATNGTHLMIAQNYHTANENNFVPIRDMEWCWHVMPMPLLQQQQQLLKQQLQPIPKPIHSPTKLQALLTANMARITWNAPARNDFQTAHAWQQWEYELEIMDVASNSAFNIRNIKTTYFNVEKLQANNLYKLRVRAAATAAVTSTAAAGGGGGGSSGGVGGGEWNWSGASEWSDELLTRTWPLGEHKFLWIDATGSVLYETNEIGANAVRIGELDMKANAVAVKDFLQLNGTIFYITKNQQELKCANIMNPEVNCTFTAANVTSLAYDWRAGKLYWTDALRNCVLRASVDVGGESAELELLPIFDAQYIQIDAYNGYIYYTTGTRLLRRTLSGTFETQELEYFHVNGYGGEIRGFALNLQQQQLYWIVRQHEGQVRLFRSRLEHTTNALEDDKLLADDIVFGSLQYLPDIESLLWLPVNRSSAVLLRTSNLEGYAYIKPTAAALNNVSCVHLKSQYTPYMLDWSIMPEAVNASSIRIDDGYWDDFNIKWTSITTAENYTVFYKVLLQYGEPRKPRFYAMEVTEPFVRITEFHQPQLLLNISITPHTYWHTGATSHTQLRTPAAAPTQPKRLRIFVQRTDRPLEVSAPNISALIRWDPPENVSLNAEISYKIFCWLGEDELFAERVHNFSSTSSGEKNVLETSLDGLHIGETYTFQVQAFAAGRLSGGEKTAYHALHVNPEVQAVPRILYATSDYIAELDLDLNARKILVHTSSEVEHLCVIQGEDRLLWVNENVELLSFVPGSTPVKLARMRAEVLALTVDWIERVVFWAEMDKHVENAVSIYKLDLCHFEGRVMLGSKLLTTNTGRLLKDLLVLPFSQTLIWLEYDYGDSNATLVGRNLSDMSVLKFKSSPLVRMFEGSLTAELETVNLVDFKGKICAYDVHRHMCNPLKMHFNVVTDAIASVCRDAGYIYALKNNSVRAYNRRKQNLEYVVDILEIRKIRAHNYQLYPMQICLLPEQDRFVQNRSLLNPVVVAFDESYMNLSLPAVNANEECWLNVPGLRYVVSVTDNNTFTRNFTSFESTLNVTQLKPFTNYTLQLMATTYYQQKLGHSALTSETITVQTAAGIPSLPQNFTAQALSPTEIFVSWNAPEFLNCDKVWYQLHWQMENSTLGAHKRLEQTSLTLNNLEPAQEYTIWLKVLSTESKFNTSSPLVVITYDAPISLQLMESTPYNLTLSWPQQQQQQPTSSTNLTKIVLVCRALNADEENEFSLDITHNSSYIVVPDLEPKTKYELYLELSYAGVSRPYYWPELFNERFVYETLGDTPSSPGKPQIEHITNEIFKVSWEPARHNGAPILEYSLEALQARSSSVKRLRREATAVAAENASNNNKTITMLSQLPWAEEPQAIEDKWLVYCNTSELSCIVRDLHTLRLLMFRVRARNEPYGWGQYSEESERIWEPFVTTEKRNSLVYAIITPAAIVSCCVIALVVVRAVQKRRENAKKLLLKSRPSIWSNVSTLQQQQQLMASRNRAFSMTSHSTLYTGGPLSDADIALLPNISWNQITLLNFLGSGAFGEVYEGLLKYDDDEAQEKVAIKSLRKGVSEFAEILQEAQLMSNFKHENIVRLIGVCFDAESISIIMEHMEGGDLLTYLRESRPNSNKPLASLQLLELMTMCIDVATGCSYLEDNHFVHRDLACRNCLVSSRVPSKRVVKIGDFGLARDIYKNDYYRKEGEGLLPVRWMSPESLVDGVFTTPSDVWAFAVLCWEILTLGQQPYAARNNFEVLNYVKDGGRLKQPENCPDKLFTLMLECWNTDAEERPSFRKCLNVLLSIKTDVRRVSLGYNLDDGGDYAMYANHNGILLSSFLANPLPQVEEEAEHVGPADSVVSENEKSETRIRFKDLPDDIEIETVSDDSQLIDEGDATALSFNANEGISRL